MIVRPATTFDAFAMSQNMRPADGAEILAWGMTPLDGLAASIARAFEVWAVEDNGEVIALFGCREEDPLTGHPWLLCGKTAARYPKVIVKIAKRILARWQRRWPLLVTWSWLGNAPHHRWLHHLGFTPINIMPVGLQASLTYEFVRMSHGD